VCHFVTFLDLQLKSCENSVFTNPDYVGDVLKGFKGFVVKFMIKMSRVSVLNSVLVVYINFIKWVGFFYIIFERRSSN